LEALVTFASSHGTGQLWVYERAAKFCSEFVGLWAGIQPALVRCSTKQSGAAPLPVGCALAVEPLIDEAVHGDA
jgi:hypothetical protein